MFVLKARRQRSLFKDDVITVSLCTQVSGRVLVVQARRVCGAFKVPYFHALLPVPIRPVRVQLPNFIRLHRLSRVRLIRSNPAFEVVFVACFHANFIEMVEVEPIRWEVVRAGFRSLFSCFLCGKDCRVAFYQDTFRSTSVSCFNVPWHGSIVVFNHCRYVFNSAFFCRVRPDLQVVLKNYRAFFLLRMFVVKRMIIGRKPTFKRSSSKVGSPVSGSARLNL